MFQLREHKSPEGEIVRNLVAINAGFYQGVVSFGGQQRLVAVVDADGNGLYNDAAKGAEPGGDRLLIDLNGDGQFDMRPTSDEVQPLGRFVLAGDRYWQIEVAPDGSSVTVELLHKPLGTIRAGPADYTLLLQGDEGVLRVRGKAGTVRAPAGKYHLTECVYRLREKSGPIWEFIGQGPEGATVVVPAGGEVKFPLGPPLTPTIDVSPPEEGRITLLLNLAGGAGETYSLIRVNGTATPPVPKGRIVDASGRELAVLVFHYG
jgi:hypothetical protein